MFNEYVKKALHKQSLTQNGLAKKIGVTSACMSVYVTGKKLPSEETLLKVAALAGISPERALIDLNLWRAAKSPERLKVWQNLSKMIQFSILILFIFNTLPLENSIPADLNNVYYVNSFIFILILFQIFKIVNRSLNIFILDKSKT